MADSPPLREWQCLGQLLFRGPSWTGRTPAENPRSGRASSAQRSGLPPSERRIQHRSSSVLGHAFQPPSVVIKPIARRASRQLALGGPVVGHSAVNAARQAPAGSKIKRLAKQPTLRTPSEGGVTPKSPTQGRLNNSGDTPESILASSTSMVTSCLAL